MYYNPAVSYIHTGKNKAQNKVEWYLTMDDDDDGTYSVPASRHIVGDEKYVVSGERAIPRYKYTGVEICQTAAALSLYTILIF